jgi:hypothetical protein
VEIIRKIQNKLDQPTDKAEINQRTMKWTVGCIAILIAVLPDWFSTLDRPLTSISQSYFAGDLSRNIFVGFLFAISAFLLSYNGRTKKHLVCSRIAAAAAFGVAVVPCSCGGVGSCESSGGVLYAPIHYLSAAVMFGILLYFCHEFRMHAREEECTESFWRARVYRVCFWTMVFGIGLLLANNFLVEYFPRVVFWGERIALFGFGLCWLVASHVFPYLTRKEGRHKLFAIK